MRRERHTIDANATREEEALKINHTEDARDTADSTKTHDDANADLRSAIDVAVNKDNYGDEYKRPVRNDVNDAVDVAGG